MKSSFIEYLCCMFTIWVVMPGCLESGYQDKKQTETMVARKTIFIQAISDAPTIAYIREYITPLINALVKKALMNCRKQSALSR